MSVAAAQIQYRQEFIAGFEQRTSSLRQTVTHEAVIKGNQATFLVADSGGRTATTRGANGLIQPKTDDLTQNTATLVEWHDLTRRTSFDIFASQSDGRRIMQETSMAVINRKVDEDILESLETGTQNTGSAAVASLSMVMRCLAILGNNAVPLDGNISAVISPAFHAYLMQLPEFSSVDYVNNKPFSNVSMMYRWAGVNFIVHPNITGKGTNAEKCIMYHKAAIGHACDTREIKTAIGYDDEQDYSFARASGFMGSTLLQNEGVVIMNHDGSAYAAA